MKQVNELFKAVNQGNLLTCVHQELNMSTKLKENLEDLVHRKINNLP